MNAITDSSSAALVIYAIFHPRGRLVLMEDRGKPIGLVFPGGNVNPGESEIDAAKREILEEIGVTPIEMLCIGSVVHKGRVASVFAVTRFDGAIPDYTLDENRRILAWRSPYYYSGRPAGHFGGYDVGKVAGQLVQFIVERDGAAEVGSALSAD